MQHALFVLHLWKHGRSSAQEIFHRVCGCVWDNFGHSNHENIFFKKLNMFLPVDILWIGGVANSPVLCVQLGTELRALGLPTTVTSLTLTSIKVLRNSENIHATKHIYGSWSRMVHYVNSKTTSQIHNWLIFPWANALTLQLWTHSER